MSNPNPRPSQTSFDRRFNAPGVIPLNGLKGNGFALISPFGARCITAGLRKHRPEASSTARKHRCQRNYEVCM